jgi:hypothetical protein
MMKAIQNFLLFDRKPGRDRTLFNGQLLDQKREDVYVVMHQMGVIR